MTNQEKIQKSFDRLHASPDIMTEVMNMTTEKKTVQMKKKRGWMGIAAAAAALVLVIGSGSVAYAKDFGGIQRKVQLWIHGDQTDAIMTVEDGNYVLTYEDADGNEMQMEGGGIAMDEDGTERPITEEELLEEINSPEVSYEDDGRVTVYYLNQQLDITDKFEDGVCYVQLHAGEEILYLTVKYQNGYAISPYAYVQPDIFNCDE